MHGPRARLTQTYLRYVEEAAGSETQQIQVLLASQLKVGESSER